MNHERLDQLMQARAAALAIDPEAHLTHETILGIFSALDKGDITAGRALHLLSYQALRLADDPTQAALYRQAAADLRQMLREEQ